MSLNEYLDNLANKSDNWSDYLLPSAVNESKQMVNGKIFSSIFLIGAVCFLFIAVMLFAIPSEEGSGQVGFMFFSGIMDAGLIIIIPMMLYQNMTSERSNGSFELMSITSITPLKIILGKWQSGLMQSLVFGSIVIPGLIFCYFFNGIAISAIFVSIILTLLASQFTILSAIFLCSLGVLKRSRLSLQLISTIANIIIFAYVMGMKGFLINYDQSLAKILTWDFISAFLIWIIFIITIECFLIAVSVGQLSPYAANKSTLPRIIYSVFLLAIVILFLFLGNYRELSVLIVFVLFAHSFITFFFLLEKDELSKKLFLKLNKKEFPIIQLYKRLFYPGKSSAYLLFIVQTLILWVAFILNLTLYSSSSSWSHYNKFDESIITFLVSCFLFYISCLYLTFILILKVFPNAKFGILGFSGLFMILLIFLVPLIPYFNSDQEDIWMVMNIIYVLGEMNKMSDYLILNLIITAIFLLIGIVVAVIHNKRSVETVRDFVAGERGAT